MELSQILLIGTLSAAGIGGGYLFRLFIFEKGSFSPENKLKEKWKKEEKSAYFKSRDTENRTRQNLKRERFNFEKERKRSNQDLIFKNKRIQQKERESYRKHSALTNELNQLNEKKNECIAKQQSNAEKLNQLLSQEKSSSNPNQSTEFSTPEKAKNRLSDLLEKEAKKELSPIIQTLTEKGKIQIKKDKLSLATQLIKEKAKDLTSEATVLSFTLPNDKLKGQIIGREGRNIRAFQVSTGVDILIDETPATILLSAFDPIRKEIAKEAIIKLIEEGKVYPSRIDSVVKQTKDRIQKQLPLLGIKAAEEIDIKGLHPEITVLLGKLHYHSIGNTTLLEFLKKSAQFAAEIAILFDLDSNTIKRAAFLHEIGFAASKELEGPHWKLGADLVKKYNEPNSIVQAIQTHHHWEKATSIESLFVAFIVNFSYRHLKVPLKYLLSHVKRIHSLEESMKNDSLIKKTYALQIGNHLRLWGETENLDENEITCLAWKLSEEAKKWTDPSSSTSAFIFQQGRVHHYLV